MSLAILLTRSWMPGPSLVGVSAPAPSAEDDELDVDVIGAVVLTAPEVLGGGGATLVGGTGVVLATVGRVLVLEVAGRLVLLVLVGRVLVGGALVLVGGGVKVDVGLVLVVSDGGGVKVGSVVVGWLVVGSDVVASVVVGSVGGGVNVVVVSLVEVSVPVASTMIAGSALPVMALAAAGAKETPVTVAMTATGRVSPRRAVLRRDRFIAGSRSVMVCSPGYGRRLDAV